MTDEQEWPAQWLRGVLSLCVLRVVENMGPVHGYAIAAELKARGLGVIGGGTLYPLLSRLERDGHVTTDWIAGVGGPAKKVYVSTAGGRELLQAEGAQWQDFARITTALLTKGKDSP